MLRNLPCLLALAAAFSCQDPETDPVTPVPPEPEGPSATVYVTDVSGKLMEEGTVKLGKPADAIFYKATLSGETFQQVDGFGFAITHASCYNLMLIRSLSKKYCVPGLRLGYVTASPIIIERLRNIRQPWTVNALALEAGKWLVENDPKVLPDLKDFLDEAQRLKQQLADIEGLMVMDTQTHYMLVNIDWATSLELKNWLIEHHGILIRDASNFYSLDDHCFRVASQTPEENDALVNAIKAFREK